LIQVIILALFILGKRIAEKGWRGLFEASTWMEFIVVTVGAGQKDGEGDEKDLHTADVEIGNGKEVETEEAEGEGQKLFQEERKDSNGKSI
jgi:hypothetical protein